MRTALYERHRTLGAKMIAFGGWEMPLLYQGIIAEHLAVRQRVGIFDVSHMGRIVIHGAKAEDFLEFLSTNTIKGKADFSATYTVLASSKGGSVDDVIVYKENSEQFFVVVNAGNRHKDLEHLKREAHLFAVEVQDRYGEDGILAIQGPRADGLISEIFPEALAIKPMHFTPVLFRGQRIVLSRTGYTGSGGFEIYAPHASIVELWELILKEGQKKGIAPIGLGARDTLRLEMGYALYGHELSEEIAPTESVSAWTVKWNKGDFLGKAALEALEGTEHKRSEHGIVLLDKGIAREGCMVCKDGLQIGKVTSGTQSPSLNQAIAIVLVEGNLQVGDRVEVKIRQNTAMAQVVKLPFYQKEKQQ
jgi:aminomethyltransferase